MAPSSRKRQPGSSHGFTKAEDQCIIHFKEVRRFSWVDIAEAYNLRFESSRSAGSLQVRYSRDLQPCKRGQVEESPESTSDSDDNADHHVGQRRGMKKEKMTEKIPTSHTRSANKETSETTVRYSTRISRARFAKNATSNDEDTPSSKQEVSAGDVARESATTTLPEASASRISRQSRDQDPQDRAPDILSSTSSHEKVINGEDGSLAKTRAIPARRSKMSVKSAAPIDPALTVEVDNAPAKTRSHPVDKGVKGVNKGQANLAIKRNGKDKAASTQRFDRFRPLQPQSSSQDKTLDASIDHVGQMDRASTSMDTTGLFTQHGWFPVNHHIDTWPIYNSLPRVFRNVPATRISERHNRSGSYRIRSRQLGDPVFEVPCTSSQSQVDDVHAQSGTLETIDDAASDAAIAYVNKVSKSSLPNLSDFNSADFSKVPGPLTKPARRKTKGKTGNPRGRPKKGLGRPSAINGVKKPIPQRSAKAAKPTAANNGGAVRVATKGTAKGIMPNSTEQQRQTGTELGNVSAQPAEGREHGTSSNAHQSPDSASVVFSGDRGLKRKRAVIPASDPTGHGSKSPIEEDVSGKVAQTPADLESGTGDSTPVSKKPKLTIKLNLTSKPNKKRVAEDETPAGSANELPGARKKHKTRAYLKSEESEYIQSDAEFKPSSTTFARARSGQPQRRLLSAQPISTLNDDALQKALAAT
ncbi:MAG: hypothetical protein M1828_007472 [Chrysothrix sp. TS-e1954]|nr:MAG: hypothetical protein M1828_007472 [Chrysothrix sp. TS-e1954]